MVFGNCDVTTTEGVTTNLRTVTTNPQSVTTSKKQQLLILSP